MLSAFRRFAQSWFARILLAVLAISFVGWGVNRTGITHAAGDEVIRAGSRTVSSLDFRREYDNYKKRIEQQSGQAITPEMAEQNHLDAAVATAVATREAFAELLSRIGIRPSDKLILDQIGKIPAFFDPVTGRFDKKTYAQRLGQNDLTPKSFEGIIRDEITAQQWAVSVQNGLVVPRAYGALAAAFALETRDLAFFTLPPSAVPPPAQPTDDQLKGFIAENKSQLTLPEMRALTVVAFTPQSVQGQLGPIDPAELKKRYDFKKDTLSKPETRTLVQIPVKDQATAQAVAARLDKGEDPAAVAKSLKIEPVDFADKPKTAISDRKVGEAVFKMTPGQVQVVQGDLGLSVVKLDSVSPGHEVTMEEARPMLEAEIKKDMLAEKVYAETQAYDDAHQAGASIADAAKKAGAAVQTFDPISKQGVDQKGQPAGLPQKILDAAFDLPQGGESDITDMGDGSYFVVKVDKTVPAHVPPLDEIRPIVTRVWIQRELVKALEAKAATLTARLDKGESIDAVAASAGFPLTRAAAISRQSAQSRQDIPREVLGRAFGSKPGESWSVRSPAGIAIGRVDNVKMDPNPDAARLADTARGQISGAVFREMGEAAETYARNKLKVKVDAAKARAAAGFEPETKSGAETKK